MSLKITRRGLETFDANVEVSIPTTGDRYIEGRFKAHFRRVPMARYLEIVDTFQRAVGNDRLADLMEEKVRTLDEILIKVEGIADENGELSPEEQREFVLTELIPLNAALVEFMTRYQGAAAKNSKPSPRH
jgi:hypothetical protein